MDSKMKVENLDLYYGKFKALKNINLDLPKNEIEKISCTLTSDAADHA